MPLATATITGVSHKLGTSIARPGVVRATYLGGAYIDDDAANTLISGVAEATVQADGSFSLVLPAGFVYSFTFTGEDSDPGWTVGPAQVDASAALDDLVLVTAPDDTKSTYQHITGLTGAATWNITYDSLVVECTLTGDATVTLTQTGEPNYRIVRIIPTLAGHTLTVAGIAITGATTLEHLTSGWVTAGTDTGPGGSSSARTVGGFIAAQTYILNPSMGTSSNAPGAPSHTFMHPVETPGMTIDQVAVNVTSAVAGGLMAMAIYVQTSSTVLTRLVDIGTFDTSTTGLKTITIPATVLPPGVVWFSTYQAAGGSMAALTSTNILPGSGPMPGSSLGLNGLRFNWVAPAATMSLTDPAPTAAPWAGPVIYARTAA